MASRFVAGNLNLQKRAPSPGQPIVRADRVEAQRLKVSPGKKSYSVAPPAQAVYKQLLPSTAPAPGYASNQYGDRNTSPNQQYQFEDYGLQTNGFRGVAAPGRDALDDITVDSEFDVTKSEISPGYEEEFVNNQDANSDGDGYDEDEYQRNDTAYQVTRGTLAHTLHHKQTMHNQPSNGQFTQTVLTVPQAPMITGRFDENHQAQLSRQARQIEDLQFRSGQGEPFVALRDQGPKKRNHSGDEVRGFKQNPRHDDSEDDDLESPEDVQVLQQRAGSPKGSQNTEKAASGPKPSPSRARKSRTIPHSQPPSSQYQEDQTFITSPDYKDDKLKTMKYKDLENEDMEMDPHAEAFIFPVELREPDVTFEQRLKYYVDAPEKDQSSFYVSLTNEEWEKAGDWFIEQFSNLLNEIKTNRQKKRGVAAKYEQEVKTRERLVRAHANKYDKKLDGMAGIGQQLLRDKTV
ncbi:uncharacterized protein L3040_001900 [Drepanopeziza brunnea f. sp. 'multigermtubi']|uniref:Extracellular mutant protein 11 C-terminal domain-containing protein n=1 Tax=Marssonina brunnea f. sp. multigermtubi (strain MB_m1) TaxID=1072389 RepID=K1Y3L0_MARBU|nr:uncharacterized protein MBM_01706 [Drepanopeziza brunnea f. sp. 'multigermtubi' MB_m1]EKD19754.1 hypothetical protein MBM_01706 [Drepanopeziza brunnea f. sp. 'multigermtubi' MB_m1]KAJ5052141.1 hypothetical protein L3040_001900 [Drepanopeziza brunnea f. sp. 'multigermtubi']